MSEQIIFSDYAFPNDAVILARKNLQVTLNDLQKALDYHHYDNYTVAHIENYIIKIKAILSAKKNIY